MHPISWHGLAESGKQCWTYCLHPSEKLKRPSTVAKVADASPVQVAVLLRLQMERLRDPEQHGVVLVLGSTDWQRQMVTKELLRMDPALAVFASEAIPENNQQVCSLLWCLCLRTWQ